MAAPAPHLRLVRPPENASAAPPSSGGAPAPAEAVAVHEVPSLLPETAPLSWEELFRTHGQYVAQVALRVLGRDDEVDDVVQEVFLVAMADLDKLRNPLAVRGWLKTVTVRKAYRVLKQRGRRRLWAMLGFGAGADGVALDSTSYPLSTQGCNPEERVLLVRIYRLLDELPAQERLAWTLRYIEGEQVETVASLCGCSLATAKRRIAAAQTFLARTLSDA